MASSINYGVTAPGGTDPYPVETALATEVGKNSPQEAYNLLNMYGIQNMVGADNYNYALAGQHDFAKQQLAAQMHENNMKALEAGYKTPGLLAAYNSPQYADIVAGIDPNQMQNASTNLERAQSAETFQKAAGGAYSAVEAGFDPNAQKLAELTGGVTGQQGEALSTKNTIIAANARLAAAALRANATKAAAGPTQSIQIETNRGKMNVTYPRSWSDAQIDADLAAKGVKPTYAPGSASDNRQLPPEANPGGQPGPQTPATPGPNKQMTQKPNNTAAGAKQLQDTIAANIENYKGHPAYADIKAGMAANGGRPLVGTDSEGKLRPKGASGKTY